MPKTLVIAHRGASRAHAENTIEAFRGARAMGADAVELDARRTADGQIVVHHDAHLPDGRAIVELAADDLPVHVPLLAAALEACEPMIVNIEIKNWPEDVDFDTTERVADAVIELARTRDGFGRWLVSCFHRPTIDRVRGLEPRLETAFLHARIGGEEALAAAVAHGHIALHPWDPLATAELIGAAHAQGVRVNVWTVDDPGRMAELVRWGADGIVTNLPDVARAVVDAS